MSVLTLHSITLFQLITLSVLADDRITHYSTFYGCKMAVNACLQYFLILIMLYNAVCKRLISENSNYQRIQNDSFQITRPVFFSWIDFSVIHWLSLNNIENSNDEKSLAEHFHALSIGQIKTVADGIHAEQKRNLQICATAKTGTTNWNLMMLAVQKNITIAELEAKVSKWGTARIYSDLLPYSKQPVFQVLRILLIFGCFWYSAEICYIDSFSA